MNWKVIALFLSCALVLAGCGQSIEEKVDEGMKVVQTSFQNDKKEATVDEGKISLYLPEDFVIDSTDDENNFLIHEGDDAYILFVNEKEPENSKLNYDLLKKSDDSSIIQIEELKDEKNYGFAMVKQFEEKEYELIVSIGGIKLTTVSGKKKIDEKLAQMLEIVRSVEIKNEG